MARLETLRKKAADLRAEQARLEIELEEAPALG